MNFSRASRTFNHSHQVSSSHDMYNTRSGGGGGGIDRDGDESYYNNYDRGGGGGGPGRRPVENDHYYNHYGSGRGWNERDNRQYDNNYYGHNQSRYDPSQDREPAQDPYYEEDAYYGGGGGGGGGGGYDPYSSDDGNAQFRLRSEAMQRRDRYNNNNNGDVNNSRYNNYGGRSTSPSMPSLIGSETSSADNSWSDNDNNNSPFNSRNNHRHRRLSHDRHQFDNNYEEEQDDEMNRKLPPRTPSNEHFYNPQLRSYNGGYKQEEECGSRKKTTSYGCSSSNKTIEVSPGVHMTLRGADETWQAVMNDFYMPSQCTCCEMTILCIQDANYVLCPQCKVISPMMPFDEEPYQQDDNNNNDGGVGLGFTMEDLAKWQDKIAYEQRLLAKQSNNNNYY